MISIKSINVNSDSLIKLNTDINLYLRTKNFSQLSELTSSNIQPNNIRITRSGIIKDNNNVLNLFKIISLKKFIFINFYLRFISLCA